MILIHENHGTVIDTVQQAVILGGALTPLNDHHKDNHNQLFRFIHPEVVCDQERQQIDQAVRYLVRLPMPNLCAQLKEMQRNKKVIATSIQTKILFEELHRMGMPGEDTPGYSISNLQKYLS